MTFSKRTQDNLLNSLTSFLLVIVIGLGFSLTTLASDFSQGNQQPVEFSLQTLDGQLVTSNHMHGKITVILFGCKGLPLMKESLAQIQRVADKHPKINVYVVLTNSNRPKDGTFVSEAELQTAIGASNLRVPVLRDPNGDQLFKKLGLRVLPSLIILNRQGELAAAAREGFDPTVNLASQLTLEIERAGQ